MSDVRTIQDDGEGPERLSLGLRARLAAAHVTGFLTQISGVKRKALLVADEPATREAEQQVLGVVERDLRVA